MADSDLAVLEKELPDFGWRLKNDQRHRGFVHECWDDAFENHLLAALFPLRISFSAARCAEVRDKPKHLRFDT